VNSKILFFLLSVNGGKKADIKETIKRMFLFSPLLRAGDKSDLCTAVDVKKVFCAHPISSNKFLVSSANKHI